MWCAGCGSGAAGTNRGRSFQLRLLCGGFFCVLAEIHPSSVHVVFLALAGENTYTKHPGIRGPCHALGILVVLLGINAGYPLLCPLHHTAALLLPLAAGLRRRMRQHGQRRDAETCITHRAWCAQLLCHQLQRTLLLQHNCTERPVDRMVRRRRSSEEREGGWGIVLDVTSRILDARSHGAAPQEATASCKKKLQLQRVGDKREIR